MTSKEIYDDLDRTSYPVRKKKVFKSAKACVLYQSLIRKIGKKF